MPPLARLAEIYTLGRNAANLLDVDKPRPGWAIALMVCAFFGALVAWVVHVPNAPVNVPPFDPPKVKKVAHVPKGGGPFALLQKRRHEKVLHRFRMALHFRFLLPALANLGQQVKPACRLAGGDEFLIPVENQISGLGAGDDVDKGAPGFFLDATILGGAQAAPEDRQQGGRATCSKDGRGPAADARIGILRQCALQSLDHLGPLLVRQAAAIADGVADGADKPEADSHNRIVHGLQQPGQQAAVRHAFESLRSGLADRGRRVPQ